MSERFDYDGLLEVNAHLREQNRVLASALTLCVERLEGLKEDGITVAEQYALEAAQAALTATSQSTAAEVHQRMFDHGDATSQEGQHG